MSYAKQDSTIARLMKQTHSALDRLREMRKNRLRTYWLDARHQLYAHIATAYRHAAHTGKWDTASFRRVAPHLQSRVRGTMEQFQAGSVPLARASFNEIYRESLLRHAWMLDVTTPVSRNVLVPHNARLHEAAVVVYGNTARALQTWSERWTQWSEAWQSALSHNLALGAMNGSGMQDAMDEVDATRGGTPGYHIWDAVSRVYDYESMVATSRAASDLADLNDDLVDEEVWKTRGDQRVCDDCDELEGVTVDEAGAYPPLHPNCNCYTLVVPKSYADLLRDGDEDDQELARDAMRQGLVPNSIILRDDDGNIGAQAVVDFGQWKQDQGYAVRSE